jgi:nanoRNase/pAp phosphatase (c-di-AMP/oligoRNAs hydrolase)
MAAMTEAVTMAAGGSGACEGRGRRPRRGAGGWGWADTYEWIGEVLHNKHAKAVTKTLGKSGHYKTPKGTRIVAMNSTSHTSDACEKLDQEADLIAGFAYEVENETEKMILSFRSHTGYNCSALARSLGGGGHTAAAGASVPVAVGESPYRTILRVVENFERG